MQVRSTSSDYSLFQDDIIPSDGLIWYRERNTSQWTHTIYCKECPRFNNAARKYVEGPESARSIQSSPYSWFPT